MPISIGPLIFDVAHDGHVINVRRLAAALRLPLAIIAQALVFKARSLNANPTTSEVQPDAALLLHTINELAFALGNKWAVIAYLSTPQPDFNAESPRTLLQNGRLQYFASYISQRVTRATGLIMLHRDARTPY